MMQKINLKLFWFLLSLLIVVNLIVFNVLSYQKEKSVLLEVHKERIDDYCKLMRYDVSLVTDRTGDIQAILDIFDSHVLIYEFIDHVFIVEDDHIKLSTDRMLTGNLATTLPYVDYEAFKHKENFDLNQYIRIPFDKPATKKHYFIYLKPNQEHIFKDINSTMSSHIYHAFSAAFLIFLVTFGLITKYIIQPIKIINHKIGQKIITYSNFEIKELDRMDQEIINSFDQLNKSKDLLESIINATEDLIFYKDKDLKYLGCNRSFLKLIGKSKNEMIGHDDFEIFDEETATLFHRMDLKTLSQSTINTNYEWVVYPDGAKSYLHTQKIPFQYCNGSIGILGISRDLTDLHAAQQQIKSLNYIDELTQLNNRKSFNKTIQKAMAGLRTDGTIPSLLMLDIDNFKTINDRFGHQEGDRVLQGLSTLMKSITREDDCVFRLGGEEFAILTQQKEHQASALAARLLEEIRKLKILKNETITVSIGVTQIKYADLIDTLYKRADDLLYKAKAEGKNRIVVG